MSFKRRENRSSPAAALAKGVRPSAANGAPVTSSGCQSLDTVLSGHGGIPLGSGVLIEENGTTDFAGVLLRYFAAEGTLQDQSLWIGGGLGESWIQNLPMAIDTPAGSDFSDSKLNERMKIAWRYSNLGEFSTSSRKQTTDDCKTSDAAKERFCHSYDLTKRMSSNTLSNFFFSPVCASTGDPFVPLLASLVDTIKKTSGILRCVLPGLLSPILYPPNASQSKYVIKFVNNLRAILRAYPSRLILMVSMPLDLYPRASQTSTWMEILLDGVIELLPLPPDPSDRDGPQGLLKIHKVPQLQRLSMEVDLSFRVSRKNFTIEAWSLPALAEEEPREGGGQLKDVRATTVDISF